MWLDEGSVLFHVSLHVFIGIRDSGGQQNGGQDNDGFHGVASFGFPSVNGRVELNIDGVTYQSLTLRFVAVRLILR